MFFIGLQLAGMLIY